MDKVKKNILITGSSGFVGRCLTKFLNDFCNVFVFDVENGNIYDHKFNINDKIDIIIHLAGKTSVPDSWKNPYEFYKINVLGTVNILELAKEKKADLIYFSSYVYGEPLYLPVDEKHKIAAISPYNHSKIISEEICEFYSNNYNINILILRPFNIYGFGQAPVFLIPTLINQFLNDEKNIVVNNLFPKRDYIYIDDILELLKIIIVSDKKFKYSIYNVGSGISYSVEQIIDILSEITGKKIPIINKKIERKNEVNDLYADVTKLKNDFGWIPDTCLYNGLSKIISKYEEKNLGKM